MKKLQEITGNGDRLLHGLAEGFLVYLEQKVQSKKANDIAENLDATLDEVGITDEWKTKAANLFYEAVNNKDSRLRTGIANLLGGSVVLVEGSDVIDTLADKIAALESAINSIEAENQHLASKVTRKRSESYGLNESTVTALWKQSSDFDDLERTLSRATKTERPPRKSVWDEQLEGGVSYNLSGEVNETNEFAQEDDHVNPQMRQYMRFFRS